MNIKRVSLVTFKGNAQGINNVQKPQKKNETQGNLLNELDNIGAINKAQIQKSDYELNLPLDELRSRTSKEHMLTFRFLDENSPEYLNLDEGDKEALKHLVRAANIIGHIQLQIDNPDNVPFSEYLDREIEKGSERALLTKQLFNGQKGISAIDTSSKTVELAKGHPSTLGRGFYPQDLEEDEFHSILINMLNQGAADEVEKILNQRTVVERMGDELVGIDYIDRFKEEFDLVADELEKASETSTNEDFNEYLRLQAKALRKADPMLDAYADKKWAQLQDTPLEFTITRENYEEGLTGTIPKNPELKALLDENGITPIIKDSLGGRVGIVNKKGTDMILNVKKYLPLMAQNMPYCDEYEQNISQDKDAKQTMVDVDLVAATGDVGSYKGAITNAENLPNSNKLSLIYLDGGRRNVYHRQIRMASSDDGKIKRQKRLDATLDPSLHKYYSNEAAHWFVVGHENGHSLGPKDTTGLGKYRSIIEENKADMISLAMVDVLTEAGLYTPEQRKQVIVSYAMKNMLPSKPILTRAHRVRSVMQNYYFIKEGAMSISKDGVLSIDIDKMVPTAQKMLKEIIKIQQSNDIEKAEKYIEENFVWTEEMETMGQVMRSISNVLHGQIESPLADKLSNC